MQGKIYIHSFSPTLSLHGLTFPDFDLATKRNEKCGYCELDLVYSTGEYADQSPWRGFFGDKKFSEIYITLYCIVFKYLYSDPQQPQANRGACGSISSKKRDKF